MRTDSQPPDPDPRREAADAIEAALRALERPENRRPDGRTPLGRRGLGGLLLAGVRRRFLRWPRLRGRRRALRRLGIGLGVVVLSVATCSAGVDTGSLTARWGPPVPATADAARSLLEKSGEAIRTAGSSRSISLTVTEAEATSALSLGLMLPELTRAADRIPQAEIRAIDDLEALRARIRAEEAADPVAGGWAGVQERIARALDPGLHTGDVQVRFEAPGHVVVAGYLQAWRFRQPVLFVVAPHAASGALELDFVEGRLGRMPLPEPVFDLLGDAVASSILLGREYAEISLLSVQDGSLRIQGRAR